MERTEILKIQMKKALNNYIDANNINVTNFSVYDKLCDVLNTSLEGFSGDINVKCAYIIGKMELIKKINQSLKFDIELIEKMSDIENTEKISAWVYDNLKAAGEASTRENFKLKTSVLGIINSYDVITKKELIIEEDDIGEFLENTMQINGENIIFPYEYLLADKTEMVLRNTHADDELINHMVLMPNLLITATEVYFENKQSPEAFGKMIDAMTSMQEVPNYTKNNWIELFDGDVVLYISMNEADEIKKKKFTAHHYTNEVMIIPFLTEAQRTVINSLSIVRPNMKMPDYLRKFYKEFYDIDFSGDVHEISYKTI